MSEVDVADQLLGLSFSANQSIDNTKLLLSARKKINAWAVMNKIKLFEMTPDGYAGEEVDGVEPLCPHWDEMDGGCIMRGCGDGNECDFAWNTRGREPSPVVKTFFIHEIIEAVSKCTGVPVHLMCSPSRKSTAVRARWVAMYVARKSTPATLEEIGNAFNRDHSSVIYGIRTVKNDRSLIDCARCVEAEMW